MKELLIPSSEEILEVELTRAEVGALIAALNFTKIRVKNVSWWTIDEQVLNKLKAAQSEQPTRY